jgi:hypothetical protein
MYDARSLRSLVPVLVGLLKASPCCPCIFIGVLILWRLTLSRPAHGQLALTYALGNAALISHVLHFVQAPLAQLKNKKASHFCEAL